MDGILVIDKPVGPTSHDVVARARRAIGERRIGHTGTLDPGATGVLPLVLGRATRLARFLTAGDKAYEAVIRLGFSTETGDKGGAPLPALRSTNLPSSSDIDSMLDTFRGTFVQQPPAYSAKKIDGERSHRLARRAKRQGTTALPPLPAPALVTVHAMDLVSLDGDMLTLKIGCSAGFYVRALAHDLGEQLGTGGHLVELRRTRSADFTLGQAVPLELVERDRDAAIAALIPLAATLPSLASVGLTAEGARRASHGRDIGSSDFLWGPVTPDVAALPPMAECVRLLDDRGSLIGIARPASACGALHPFVILR